MGYRGRPPVAFGLFRPAWRNTETMRVFKIVLRLLARAPARFGDAGVGVGDDLAVRARQTVPPGLVGHDDRHAEAMRGERNVWRLAGSSGSHIQGQGIFTRLDQPCLQRGHDFSKAQRNDVRAQRFAKQSRGFARRNAKSAPPHVCRRQYRRNRVDVVKSDFAPGHEVKALCGQQRSEQFGQEVVIDKIRLFLGFEQKRRVQHRDFRHQGGSHHRGEVADLHPAAPQPGCNLLLGKLPMHQHADFEPALGAFLHLALKREPVRFADGVRKCRAGRRDFRYLGRFIRFPRRIGGRPAGCDANGRRAGSKKQPAPHALCRRMRMYTQATAIAHRIIITVKPLVNDPYWSAEVARKRPPTAPASESIIRNMPR